MTPRMRSCIPARYATARNTGTQRDGRAEIGFLGDQRERQRGQRRADGQIGPAGRAAVLAEELGEHQRHADLGELRRLEVERAERDPAPRAHLHVAEEQHVEQHAEQRRRR